ncbi:MAG: PsbP-related protein [Candidatus Paceibacterota bacterium]|jgi:hypothetical protein
MPFITQGKINVKYLAIVLIVAVLAGAGILLYQQDLDKKSAEIFNQGQQKVLAGNQKIEGGTGVEEKAIYNNKEYGFSINYPKNWTISENFATGTIVRVENYFVNESGDKDGAYFNVDIIKNTSDNVQEWINKNNPIAEEGETLQEVKNLNIDGEVGIYRIKTSDVAGGYFNDLTVKHNDNIYYITTKVRVLSTYEKENKEYQEAVDNIISSFKFNN